MTSRRRGPRVCAEPGCGRLVEGEANRCDDHRRAEARRKERGRPSSSQRGYGRDYRRARAEVLARQPFCSTCGAAGSDANPLQVDHIVAVSRGGPSADPANLQVLCRSCNSRKGAR